MPIKEGGIRFGATDGTGPVKTMKTNLLPPPTLHAGISWLARMPWGFAAALILFVGSSAFGQNSFSVGTNLVDISQKTGNETDPSIAISPLNSSNMVVAAATDAQQPGLFFAFTTNLGKTWYTNYIATNSDSQGLTPGYGEPSVAWDSFGNLFLAYMPYTFEGVAIAVSTNNGSNFMFVTNLAKFDSTDQPRITSAYSGKGAGSVWVVYKDYTTTMPIFSPLQVQSALSTGLGSIGTFGVPQIVPESTDGGFADIAVGPLGQVMVAFQDNLDGDPDPAAYPTANIWAAFETNDYTGGIITNSGFLDAEIIASDAIGGRTYIAAAPTGIGINAAPGLMWNCNANSTNYDEVGIVYTAVGPNQSAVINYLTSTDFGTNALGVSTNWNQTYVDDDAAQGNADHFLPRTAIDQETGILVCSWFDCRNDQGGASAPITNVFTAKFTFSSLSMVTNVFFTNDIPDISETWTTSTSGKTTNISIFLTADNAGGTVITNDGISQIFVGDSTTTNFIMDLAGTNEGSVTVTITVTNLNTEGYTGGTPNSEPVMYSTISFDGGRTFLANQQLSPANQLIVKPAVGVASEVSGSTSLTGWGHYTGLAAYGASFFPVWPDNSDVTTNNPDGAHKNFDLYMITSGPGQSGISVPVANLRIWVTNSPNPVISAGVLVYSVIVSNGGPKTATPLTVTNILSTNVTLIPNGVIPALGGTYTVDYTTNGQEEVIFNLPSLPALGLLTNTIRVTATTSGIDTNFASVYTPFINLSPTNATNQLVVIVEGQDLTMSLGASETNVLIGDTVVSWVTVTNLGPATNGPVYITNYFSPNWTNVTIQAQGTNLVTNTPSGTIVIADLGLLPVGKPVTAYFTAVALSGDAFGDTTNASEYAVVSSQDYDTNLLDNAAALNFYINGENLAVGLVTPATNVDQGVPFVYSIYVTNLGNSYSGQVVVTNMLSTNLQPLSILQSQGTVTNYGVSNQLVFNLGTIGAGEIAEMSITAESIGLPPVATSSVTVSSSDFDLNLVNNSVTNAIGINGEDLAVVVTPSSASVDLGQSVTFSIVVDNFGLSYNGVITVTNVVSSNLVVTGETQSQGTNVTTGNQTVFTLGALGVRQSAVLTVTAMAVSGPAPATDVALVSETDFDLFPANNAATNAITVNNEDLAIGVTVSPSTQQVGQPVTFNEIVTNIGLSFNGDVLVTNTISTNLGSITVLRPSSYTINGNVIVFDLGQLSAGQTVPIAVSAIPTSVGTGSLAAGVSSLSFDTNLANNSATAKLTITKALPMISNIVVTPLASSAFISFKTGYPATVQVLYGNTTNYGSVTSETSAATTNHAVLLTGLAGGTNYDFQIQATVYSKLYTTNGTFSTTTNLILTTVDARYSGLWTEGAGIPGIYDTTYQYTRTTNSNANAWSSFDPSIPASGLYNVYVWYPQNVNFTTNAQVYFYGATNQFSLSVNQTTNGGAWLPLATNMYFSSGTNGAVLYYNDTGETNKYLVVDAMMWTYDAAQDYPTNGTVPAWWANFYFGTNVNGYVNGASDVNGTGYSVFDDYVLGLNPTDTNSTVNFTVAPMPGSQVAVTFSPWQGGRNYELQSTTDLSQGAWTTLTNTYTVGTNGSGTFIVSQPNAVNAFYRLQAQLSGQ